MEDIEEEVRRISRILSTHGLRTGVVTTGPGFGDFFAEFCSGMVLVRLIRDRGCMSLEVSSPKAREDGFDLPLVISEIEGHGPQHADYSAQISFLEKRFDEVVQLFSASDWESLRKNLVKRRRDRASAVFPNLRPDRQGPDQP